MLFSQTVGKLMLGRGVIQRLSVIPARASSKRSDAYGDAPGFLSDDDVVIETPRPESTMDSIKEANLRGPEVPEGSKERSLNSVNLIGRVGADPIMRGNKATPVLTFSLATNISWKAQDGSWTHRTDWHNISVFRNILREQAYQYVAKGRRLHIQGRIAYGEIIDQQGIRRHTTSIIADDIIYLDAGANKQSTSSFGSP